MPKTRLTNYKRESILSYMKTRYAERIDMGAENDARARMVALINAALRSKYPEDEMVILRKYRCTSKDRCLRFQQTSNGRVFGIDFYDDNSDLADIARHHGCQTNDVFPVSDDLPSIWEHYEQLKTDRTDATRRKYSEYAAFIEACKTVEDVETVVPLAADIRLKLTGSNTALVAVSDEIVASLRNEFSEAA
jgi:hypothetical protein